MANCDWCGQPTGGKHPAQTCTANLVEIEVFLFRPVPYDGSEGTRCPGCRVIKGGDHHPGCDFERCPVCMGNLNECGCLAEDELEDEE